MSAHDGRGGGKDRGRGVEQNVAGNATVPAHQITQKATGRKNGYKTKQIFAVMHHAVVASSRTTGGARKTPTATAKNQMLAIYSANKYAKRRHHRRPQR